MNTKFGHFVGSFVVVTAFFGVGGGVLNKYKIVCVTMFHTQGSKANCKSKQWAYRCLKT